MSLSDDLVEAADREAARLDFHCPSCRHSLGFREPRCAHCGESVEDLQHDWEDERERILERLSQEAARGRWLSWRELAQEKRNRGRLRPWDEEEE